MVVIAAASGEIAQRFHFDSLEQIGRHVLHVLVPFDEALSYYVADELGRLHLLHVLVDEATALVVDARATQSRLLGPALVRDFLARRRLVVLAHVIDHDRVDDLHRLIEVF